MAARHRQAKKRAREALGVGVDQVVTCGECGRAAGLVDGRTIYPHRPDLAAKLFWRCTCGAYIGCHDGTSTAKGTPCGPETRAARIAAHAAFDPLWRRKAERDGISVGHARGKAYRWLAEQLGLTADETHIGMFDAATARRVVELCTPKREEAA